MNRLHLHILRDHVLLGAAASAVAWGLRGPTAAGMFFAASLLIDADHYLHFLFASRFRRWSPGAMMAFHRRSFGELGRRDFLSMEVFHCAEFLLACAAAVLLLRPSLLPALCGMLFHVAVDLVFLARQGALSKRAHAYLDFWLRRRRMLRRGLSPDWLYGRG